MSNYVYVNENTPPNVVGAFIVNSSGQLSPLSTPTYPTGGHGTPSTTSGVQNSAISQLGPYLYVVNSDDYPYTTISGFQIIPSTGALMSLFSPPVSTGSRTGITGELLCSPNGQFLYVLNTVDSTITIYSILSTDGTLTMVGSPFLVFPLIGL